MHALRVRLHAVPQTQPCDDGDGEPVGPGPLPGASHARLSCSSRQPARPMPSSACHPGPPETRGRTQHAAATRCHAASWGTAPADQRGRRTHSGSFAVSAVITGRSLFLISSDTGFALIHSHCKFQTRMTPEVRPDHLLASIPFSEAT